MNKEELGKYKERLITLREQVVNAHEKTVETSQEEFGGGVPDVNDEAARTMQRRIMLQFGDSQHDALRMIDEAIERIEEGGYGECEECGEDIPKKRLELIPYATFCVTCKEKAEQEEKENG